MKRLAECYYDIRAGIGDYKTPEVYGAFPMDPYSHTPAQGGARQPGLTGQVKEDILCRFGELGVSVREGCIHFEPRLLRQEEFLSSPATFAYFDVAGSCKETPAQNRRTRVHLLSGADRVSARAKTVPDDCISPTAESNGRMPSRWIEENSRAIFERTGIIQSVAAGVLLPI